MRRCTHALLAAALAASAAHAQPPALGLAAHVDSLNAATRAGDFARALAHVEAALRVLPGDVPLLDQLVRTHGRLRDSAGVLRSLDQALPVGGIRPVLTDSIFGFMAADPRFQALGAGVDRTLAPLGRPDTVAVLGGAERLGEGIAADLRDPAGLTLYVGARTAGGRILRVRPGPTGTVVSTLVDSTGAQVLGMRTDGRGQLWANLTFATPGEPARSELVVVRLATGEIVRRYRSPADGRAHLFNDVAFGPDGSAYVTDTERRAVYVVPAGSRATEVGVFSAGDADFPWPNGIAVSPDGTWLYVAHLGGVDAWRLATGARQRVATTRAWPLESFDGLYACSGALVAVQALPGVDRVVWLELDSTGTRVRTQQVLDQAPDARRSLSTGAPVGDAFYYHTRPVVVRERAPGAAPAEPETVLHRVPLPRRCS